MPTENKDTVPFNSVYILNCPCIVQPGELFVVKGVIAIHV